MRKAIEAFEEDFAQWNLRLPEDAITAKRGGQIRESGWSLRYNFGSDSRGEYLDYYAVGREVVDNPPSDDLHVRIYESGDRVALPTVLEAYMYGRDPTWEELERARKKYEDQLESADGAAGPAAGTPLTSPPSTPAPAATTANAPPSKSTEAPGVDQGVVGLPPLDAPDTYLALDIGLDLDLDIGLDATTNVDQTSPAEPAAAAAVSAPADFSEPGDFEGPGLDLTPPVRPGRTRLPTPDAPLVDPAASTAAAPAFPLAQLSPDESTDHVPRAEIEGLNEAVIEVAGLEFADDWTITPEQVATSAAEGDTDAGSAIEPLEGLTGLTPEQGVPLTSESAAAPSAVPPRPAVLEEVQQDDLVIFFPTEPEATPDNAAPVESDAPVVDDNSKEAHTPPAASPRATDVSASPPGSSSPEAPPPPSAPPSRHASPITSDGTPLKSPSVAPATPSRPAAQPPAEAVSALVGAGMGRAKPRADGPSTSGGKGAPPPSAKQGAPRSNRPAPSRQSDAGDMLDDGLEGLGDVGLSADADLFRPWWNRAGGRRKAIVMAVAAAVLIVLGIVAARVMHWPRSDGSYDAAQAVDSVNRASSIQQADGPPDSTTPEDSPSAAPTASGTDSSTGTGDQGADAQPPGVPTPTPAGVTGSADGGGGMARPAGPNSVPAIVPSRRSGPRTR